MKYLKKFNTVADYEAAKDGLITPNVSLINETMGVAYNPYVDPYAGHDYVEIGGLKWATMNVGANSVTDYGLHFQWGDTQGYTASQVGCEEGKKCFSWQDYKYWTGNTGSGSSGMTKYNSTDGKTVLEASDDAVQVNWGGSWRMPTVSDLQALWNAVNTAWTADYQGSGVAGAVFTDKTDSSKVLFFPACGRLVWGMVNNVGSNCYYWSSSLFSDNVEYADILSLNSTGIVGNMTYRYYGYCVRGVAD